LVVEMVEMELQEMGILMVKMGRHLVAVAVAREETIKLEMVEMEAMVK
jgi:hypothetical protein